MDKYLCNLNKDHVLKEPKLLPICNQIVCNSCVEMELDYKKHYYCLKCEQYHEKGIIDIMLSETLKEIRIDLYEKSNEISNFQLNRLKNKKNKILLKSQILKDKVDNYFNFIEHEIDIRFESLNQEIDKLKLKLDRRLANHQNKRLKTVQEAIGSKDFDIRLTENAFKNLKMLDNFKFNNKSSEKVIDQNSIGTITSPFINFNNVSKRNFETIDLSNHLLSACGLCSINNEYLLITDFTSNRIIKLDKSFKRDSHIRERNLIRVFNYYGLCASNDFSRIFITDVELNRVLIVNHRLDTIYSYITKTPIHSEFGFVRDICYYDDKFFILDLSLRLVYLFKSNGKFLSYFDLNAKNLATTDDNFENKSPLGITAIEDKIAILDLKRYIFIYNYRGDILKKIGHDGATSLLFINNYLFVHSEDGRLVAYLSDDDNNFNKIIDIFYDEIKHQSETMCYFNGNLVISFGWKRFLAVLNLI